MKNEKTAEKMALTLQNNDPLNARRLKMVYEIAANGKVDTVTVRNRAYASTVDTEVLGFTANGTDIKYTVADLFNGQDITGTTPIVKILDQAHTIAFTVIETEGK